MATSKSWVVAVLLSLFLGFTGFDLLYMGYPKLAVVKFLTLGFFGIGWPITALLIMTKRIHPADGTW
jgi:TM2 domain-containing membrane protein YozV